MSARERGRQAATRIGVWGVERRSLSAAEFHALDVPDPAERAVWVADTTGPALVLGSTQPESDVRPDVDLEVVRRRSGGGAVLVVPGDVLWIDVVVPADDPLWDDDVGRAHPLAGRRLGGRLGGAGGRWAGAQGCTGALEVVCCGVLRGRRPG